MLPFLFYSFVNLFDNKYYNSVMGASWLKVKQMTETRVYNKTTPKISKKFLIGIAVAAVVVVVVVILVFTGVLSHL
jgi:hypothetical protein